jgi:hypothetical protein
MSRLTAFAISDAAIRALGANSIPGHWFNWAFQTPRGELRRLTIVQDADRQEIADWYERCKLAGVSPGMVVLSGARYVGNWSDDENFEPLRICAINPLHPEVMSELAAVLQGPEEDIACEWSAFRMGGGSGLQRYQVNSPMWEAYARELSRWMDAYSEVMGDIDHPYAAYRKWPKERMLCPDDFAWPEAEPLADVKNFFIPLRQMTCCGVGLVNGIPKAMDPNGGIRNAVLKIAEDQSRSEVQASAFLGELLYVAPTQEPLQESLAEASSTLGKRRESYKERLAIRWRARETKYEYAIYYREPNLNIGYLRSETAEDPFRVSAVITLGIRNRILPFHRGLLPRGQNVSPPIQDKSRSDPSPNEETLPAGYLGYVNIPMTALIKTIAKGQDTPWIS